MIPNPQIPADLVTITEDILMKNFILCAVTDLNFTHKLLKLRNFTVKQIINEWAIWGSVYNLKNETTFSKKGQTLLLRKIMIKGEQGKISLVFFHVLTDDVENNKYHEFKKLRVQKFMNEVLIKSTET